MTDSSAFGGPPELNVGLRGTSFLELAAVFLATNCCCRSFTPEDHCSADVLLSKSSYNDIVAACLSMESPCLLNQLTSLKTKSETICDGTAKPICAAILNSVPINWNCLFLLYCSVVAQFCSFRVRCRIPVPP